MKPRLYLLWIHLCTFFPMFAIHMCEKICFFPEILVRHYVLCVCTCTNQLVLSTEVTRLNFLNSIVMGQINQCGFQSHVAIDRYCIFLEINTFELSWVELSWVDVCQCWPQTLATICRNMGIWDVFMLHPPQKIYLGFVAFAGTVPTRSDSNLAPYVTPLLTHWSYVFVGLAYRFTIFPYE